MLTQLSHPLFVNTVGDTLLPNGQPKRTYSHSLVHGTPIRGRLKQLAVEACQASNIARHDAQTLKSKFHLIHVPLPNVELWRGALAALTRSDWLGFWLVDF